MWPAEIMCDLDEVVYPFLGAFYRWLMTVHPHPVPFSNRQWNFHRDLGIDDAQFAAYLHEFGRAGGYDFPVAPLSSIHAIVDLWNHGHRIHIVTARPNTDRVRADTERWLKRVGMPFDTLTMSSDKTAFLRFVRSQVSYAVDDKPENVVALRAAGVRAVMFAQPHNAEQRVGLPVVKSLEEFRTGVLARKWK